MDCNFSGIGGRINERLKEMGLKQTDLCRETGLSTTAISQYCTEKRIPDTTSLFKISNVLKTSMEWMLTGEYLTIENLTNENLTCDGIPLSTDENDLIAMYRLLGNREREDIFDFVNMKYEKATGEKESIYSTYFEEKKKYTKSSPIKDNESHTETA